MNEPSAKLEPAHSLVKALGGINEVAEYLGLHRSTVWRWEQPQYAEDGRKVGGRNGLIPSVHHEILLAWGRSRGKPIGPENFFAPANRDVDVTGKQQKIAC